MKQLKEENLENEHQEEQLNNDNEQQPMGTTGDSEETKGDVGEKIESHFINLK